MHRQRHQRAAVALEPSRELELEQNHAHGGGRASGQANRDRRSAPASARAMPRCARVRRRAGSTAGSGGGVGLPAAAATGSPRIGRTTVIDVGGFRDEGRALPEQVVAAFGARIERGAGHREHFAALFEREACGDQRAGAPGRFHHHDADRKPRDEPVAAGKSRARGSQPSGISEIRAPSAAMASARLGMLARVDVILAAGEHRDRSGREAPAMGGRVDAAREP